MWAGDFIQHSEHCLTFIWAGCLHRSGTKKRCFWVRARRVCPNGAYSRASFIHAHNTPHAQHWWSFTCVRTSLHPLLSPSTVVSIHCCHLDSLVRPPFCRLSILFSLFSSFISPLFISYCVLLCLVRFLSCFYYNLVCLSAAASWSTTCPCLHPQVVPDEACTTVHDFLDCAKRGEFKQGLKLLKRAPEWLDGDYAPTPCPLVTISRWFDNLTSLPAAQPNGRWSFLHQAAATGDEAVVKDLLVLKADVTLTNRDGQTALQLAAAFPPVEKVLKQAVKSSKSLSEKEAGPLSKRRRIDNEV